MEREVYDFLKEEITSLSHVLLKNYAKIGLSDQEMMLIIHLLAFKKEGKDFPTVTELGGRMAADGSAIISLLQRLVQRDFIAIEESYDETSGIRYERYEFDPLYRRISKIILMEKQESVSKPVNKENDLYTVFEREFGRPLSPIECETLAMWLEHDKYNVELIKTALREAVVSAKLSFRYIDRILFDWQHQNIRTPKEAKEYSLRFRKHQQKQTRNESGQTSSIPFFNWLEYDKEMP